MFCNIITVDILNGLLASAQALRCLFIVKLNLLYAKHIFLCLQELFLLFICQASSEESFQNNTRVRDIFSSCNDFGREFYLKFAIELLFVASSDIVENCGFQLCKLLLE
jgi:hypothetical protein